MVDTPQNQITGIIADLASISDSDYKIPELVVTFSAASFEEARGVANALVTANRKILKLSMSDEQSRLKAHAFTWYPERKDACIRLGCGSLSWKEMAGKMAPRLQLDEQQAAAASLGNQVIYVSAESTFLPKERPSPVKFHRHLLPPRDLADLYSRPAHNGSPQNAPTRMSPAGRSEPVADGDGENEKPAKPRHRHHAKKTHQKVNASYVPEPNNGAEPRHTEKIKPSKPRYVEKINQPKPRNELRKGKPPGKVLGDLAVAERLREELDEQFPPHRPRTH